MVGSFEIRGEFFKDICKKSFGLAQWHVEYLAQGEGGFNSGVAELLGFASFSGLLIMLPVFHCLLGDPEKYLTPIH